MNPEQTTHLQTFIRLLSSAVSTSLLYTLQHQQVSRLCTSAMESLTAAMGIESEVSLLLIDQELVVDDRPLPTNMYINRFSQTLKNRGIGNLRLLRGITVHEFRMLVGTLARLGPSAEQVNSTDNVRFGRVEIGYALAEETEGLTHSHNRIKSLADIPLEELATFLDIYEEARKNKKINVVGISEIVSCFIDAFKQVADPLMALAPLRAMDEYTFTHSTNVCILNLAQAMSLGIDGPLLNEIGVAAMLHDIGKLYVPEEVLTKQGKLDDAEWEMIKQHPLKGAQRLLDTPGVPRLAVVTAYEHHLKFNLTGYPKVTEGWRQNLCSHMTTISDFFDALRTKRAYRGSMEFVAIASMMSDMSGTDLHPVLTRNFLQVIGKLSEQPLDVTKVFENADGV